MNVQIYTEAAQRLDYDPETGNLFWKYDDRMPSRWNTRYAGKQAGCKAKDYRKIKINHGDGVEYSLISRRIAWFIVYGSLPELVVTINGDPYDDSIANLRASTLIAEGKKAKRPSNNKTGVTGVCYLKSRGKYLAAVKFNRSTKGNTKYFDTLDAAESWVKQRRLELGFNASLHGRS